MRKAGWSANCIQQKAGGCIVALFDRGFAQRAQGHPGVFEPFFCHRRMFQDVFCAIRHEPIQFLLFLIDALQHRGCGEKFERTAHRKPFFRPMIETLTVTGVERGHTDSAADSCLYRCNPGCRIIFCSRCICREEG